MKLVRNSRALAILLFLGLLSACTVNKAALVQRVNLQDVDPHSVPDGVYEGEYTIDPSPAMAANKHVKDSGSQELKLVLTEEASMQPEQMA